LKGYYLLTKQCIAMKNIKLFIMLLAVVPIMIVGCKKEGKAGNTSNVKFNLTDAPANFDSLNIDVQSIQVHSVTSGWITLNSSIGTINILSYVNGSAVLAAQADLSAGAIDQIRLVLGSNNSVVVGGHSFSLSTSSSAALQSALTINVSGQLNPGDSYVFTIDFDAAQSVTATGGGSYQLSPVLRLIVDQTTIASTSLTLGGSNTSITDSNSINLSTGISVKTSGTGTGSVVISGNGTGNIAGSLGVAGLASVCVTGANGSTFCTMTNLAGQFSMQALGAGTYTVTITPTVALLGSVHVISNVVVTAGQTTNLGIVAM
jgi:uncharacterized protein DUF4382